MLLYTESLQLFTRFIQFCHSLPFLRRLLLFQKKHDMLGDTVRLRPPHFQIIWRPRHIMMAQLIDRKQLKQEMKELLRSAQVSPRGMTCPVPGPGAGAEPGGQLHGSYESGPAGHLHLHPHRPDEHGPGLRLRDVLHGHPPGRAGGIPDAVRRVLLCGQGHPAEHRDLPLHVLLVTAVRHSRHHRRLPLPLRPVQPL